MHSHGKSVQKKMTSLFFSKYAMQELDDAANFYEMEFEGFGQSFKEEVKRAVLRIAGYTEVWPVER